MSHATQIANVSCTRENGNLFAYETVKIKAVKNSWLFQIQHLIINPLHS